MQLHTLQRLHPHRKSRQIGRGGKRGKTSGRGTKGQKARAGHRMRPEFRDILKKIPKMRGRGKNLFTSVQVKPAVLNVEKLEKYFAAGDTVSLATLVSKKVFSSRAVAHGIKILGTGTLSKKLTLAGLSVSASARAAVEKAGGSVTEKTKEKVKRA